MEIHLIIFAKLWIRQSAELALRLNLVIKHLHLMLLCLLLIELIILQIVFNCHPSILIWIDGSLNFLTIVNPDKDFLEKLHDCWSHIDKTLSNEILISTIYLTNDVDRCASHILCRVLQMLHCKVYHSIVIRYFLFLYQIVCYSKAGMNMSRGLLKFRFRRNSLS